jgi:hypothetical protein
MTQNLTDPETLLSDVLAYIEEACAILERGEWVDLKGLDAQVERLCKQIVLLTPEQGREFAAELDFLRARLNTLQETMQAQAAQLQDDLKEVGTVQRANRAYAQGTQLGGKKNKPEE